VLGESCTLERSSGITQRGMLRSRAGARDAPSAIENCKLETKKRVPTLKKRKTLYFMRRTVELWSSETPVADTKGGLRLRRSGSGERGAACYPLCYVSRTAGHSI